MCARTEAPISYRGAREKNAACKNYSAACKIYSPSRRMGKCKPQKIFSKPHFSGQRAKVKGQLFSDSFFSSNAETQRRKDFFFRV